VPKTTVDEDGEALTPENEVRPARQALVAPPASDSACAEHCGESQLRIFVPLRSDRRHDFGSLLFCEHIGHGERLAGLGAM
jgi:hypothetical protein